MSVTVDFYGADELMRRLQALENGPAILRKALAGAATEVKRKAQEIVYLGHPAGHLYRGVRRGGEAKGAGGGGHLRSSIHSVVHGHDYAEVGTNVIYARVHEFGATIRAKNKPYLVFQTPTEYQEKEVVTRSGKRRKTVRRVGMHWVRVKQVTIPKRPFLGPALEQSQAAVRAAFERPLREALGL